MVARKLMIAAAIATTSVSVPVESRAQVAVGVRYGQGEGTANYNVGEVHGRIRVWGPGYATVLFQTFGGAWDCVADPAVSCGYDGHSLSFGGALAVVDIRHFYLGVGANIGGFSRNSSFSDTRNDADRHLTAGAGVDGELRVFGPVRLQAGLAHRRIFDSEYRDSFGRTPHLTSITAGLSVVLLGHW